MHLRGRVPASCGTAVVRLAVAAGPVLPPVFGRFRLRRRFRHQEILAGKVFPCAADRSDPAGDRLGRDGDALSAACGLESPR